MKKGLLTIALSLFILIPISINAEITCTYNPVNSLGDNYGEINITKKDDGSFLINGNSFSESSIDLNYNLNNASLYFAGSDVKLSYYNIDPDNVFDSLESYCNNYKQDSCPASNNNINSFYKVVCEDRKDFKDYCRLDAEYVNMSKKDNLIPRGNLAVLKQSFTGNTCPTLNFVADYNKSDYSKMYLVLLGSADLVKSQPIVAKTSGSTKNANDEFNVNTVYYSEAKKDDMKYFSSVTYNKTTGNLKFVIDSKYSTSGASWSMVPTNGTSHTEKIDVSIPFVNAYYDMLQFQVYGDLQSNLKNWKSDDRLYIMFSDGQGATLTHYLVGEADLQKFCVDIWGYNNTAAHPDCQAIADSVVQKGDDEYGTRNPVNLDNFDIELIPFCAPNSGALTVFKIIGYALVVIKILVPIALMIFGSIDFFKVMVGNNPDDMSKAVKAFIQRGIVAILVFLAPGLIRYFVGLIGNSISKEDSYFQNCNTCLLKPDDCPNRKTLQVTEKK